MRNPLSMMSLKYQVGVAGAISLVGLASLGTFVAYSSQQESTVFARAEAATAAKDALAAAEISLLNARRAEKDFLARRDTSYADTQAAAVAAAAGHLDDLVSHLDAAALEAEAVSAVDEVSAGLGRYTTAFDIVRDGQIAIGLDQDSGLTGAMRAAVRAVEELIVAGGQDDLTIELLTMRRHEKDFIARIDPKYALSMDETLVRFDAALADADMPSSVRAEIEEHMATYHAAFDELVAATLQQQADVAILSDEYTTIEPVVELLDEEILGNYTTQTAAFRKDRESNRTLLTWALGTLAALIAAATVIVARGVYRPLRAIIRTMNLLADGDREVGVDGTDRGDEIGDMAAAVQVFKDNAIETERMRAEQARRDQQDRADDAQRLAEEEARRNDRVTTVERERQSAIDKRLEMGALADSFERSVTEVLEFVAAASTEMQATAAAMAGTAADTSMQSEEVSAASSQASMNVQAVAVAAEELSASVREISRQVAHSAAIAGDAVAEIERTNATVRGLAQAAEKIGAVVSMVNEIASQTNLLALNATIEAARAGEAGKGFAVVASEVKDLAKQTAEATEEIASQIASIQATTGDAVAVIAGIGTTIAGVSEIATAIASAVEEQGVAVQDIARNVDEAANGTRRVSSSIASVSSAAGATRTAAHDVLSASGELSMQSEQLRAHVHDFLTRVSTFV